MPSENDDGVSDSPKPVVGFPQYAELPLELRLQVVEEVIKIPSKHRDRLSTLAVVHSEWSHVIERVLFKNIILGNMDAREFGRICGKRQNLVDSVSLNLRLRCLGALPVDDLVWNRQTIKDNIFALFHAMEDWSYAERTHRLITLSISLPDRCRGWVNGWTNAETTRIVACDFTDLPVVPVIGQLFTKEISDALHFIEHSTLDVLHKKLPNLHGTSLALPSGVPLQETIHIARSRMIGTHTTKPSLSMLSIIQDPSSSPDFGSPDFKTRSRKKEITIARSLTPMVSLWGKTLVSLKIDCVIDIPQFISTASDSTWPNLETIDVAAILDEDEGSEPPAQGALDPENDYRAVRELLQGLTAALPGMRSLTRFDVQFRDPTTGFWACCVCMDLRTKVNTKALVCHPRAVTITGYLARHSGVVPCECGSLTEGGTLVTRHVVIPGELLTEFQKTVWQYRHQKLGVWCCRICQIRWGGIVYPLLPCTKWNQETGCWDFAFLNDMDVFIWHMGNFFCQMVNWDALKSREPATFRRLLDADFEEDFRR